MSSTPVLSLVIPVFNEARHLRQWCEQLFAFSFDIPVEMVFVDDCSTDGSTAILRDLQRKDMHLIELSSNHGKGAALAAGIAKTRGQVVMVQDADFEYVFSDIAKVVRPILEDEADVVYGSRYKHSQTVHRTFHYAINRFLTLASNLASGLYLSDMETCYKAFRGDLIRSIPLESPRFGFEPEITAKIARLRVRVAEVPIRYYPRTHLQGKKIRWTDGIAALWHIARFNLAQDGLGKVPEKYRDQRP